MRVKRGADVATDHHLLIARLKLKLKKNWMRTTTNRRKYNVFLLKDPQTRAEYKLNLANKFQVLQKQYEEEEPDLNSLWQNIKEILTSNCQEVVGPKKRQQKDWITAETWGRIQLRKEKKSATNNSRTRAFILFLLRFV